MQERDIALINEFCQKAAESTCVEFKKDNSDPKVIGKLCSAISNVARIEGLETGYVLWGIEDGSHAVVGTQFNPDAEKMKIGKQAFQIWLASQLKPSIAFSFRSVAYTEHKKVVILEIPAATSAPVEFQGTAHIRIGSATPKLSDYPDRFQKLVDNIRPYAWEKSAAKIFLTPHEILEYLDYTAYFKLTRQNLPENPKAILERLEVEQLIFKDFNGHWNISNMGAILFATDLTRFDSAIARKAVRFSAYKGNNRACTVTHRRDDIKGYASGFEALINYINTLLPQNEQKEILRKRKPVFPEIAVRELIANALIHQDMTIRGAGPLIELFSDRLEITNPGHSLVQIDRMIDFPPRSRNEKLASLMRRMGIYEEQGTGLDNVIEAIETEQLPPPKFQALENDMRVILYSPQSFADMTLEERVRACYQHTVIKYLGHERMKNASLRERLAISQTQASRVIKKAIEDNKIRPVNPNNPREGYVPCWV